MFLWRNNQVRNVDSVLMESDTTAHYPSVMTVTGHRVTFILYEYATLEALFCIWDKLRIDAWGGTSS